MTSELLSGYYENFHAERQKTGTVELPERIEMIRTVVGSGHDVIDLGCRYGALLENFAAGNRVVGIDVDRDALERCEQRVPGVTTRRADLNGVLPFEDASFDVAVMSEVLEHLPYPEITLREVVRILRPTGVFVGSVPNALHLRNRLRFLSGGPVELDRTHLQHYGEEALHGLLSRFFAEVEVFSSGGRYRRISSGLFARYLLFRASVPRSRARQDPRPSIEAFAEGAA